MKEIFKLVRRLFSPYKEAVLLNIIFNFLGALFGIFSFVAMIPVLRIIFRLETGALSYHKVKFSLANLKEFMEALQHNLNVYLTDMSIQAGSFRVLVFVCLVLLLMVFLKVGFTYLAAFFMVKIRNKVVRDIRNNLYQKILYLPIGFFTTERKGDIISRMTNDVQEIENSVVNSLDMLIKNPIIILVSVITMVIMSWELTLFVCILFPVAGFIIGQIGKSLKKSSMEGQNKLGQLLSMIEESLSGLRIIKAFNAEIKTNKRFKSKNEEFRHLYNRIHWRRLLAHPVSELLGTLVIILVLFYGGNIILSGESRIDAANFLVYLIVFYNIINPSKAFAQEYYGVQKGLASMERVDRILNEQVRIVEAENAVRVNRFEQMAHYREVSFRYNQEPVLENITLEIKKGMSLAIVGQSGSGKSTLVDLLPRFYDVSGGQILIDGTDIREIKISDLRSLMGIVNQEPILFNDTFFNNIAFGVEHATPKQVEEAARIANAHDFIMATEEGYQTNIGDRGSRLSGGQRQRISIARAVLKNPPILILDEATSALDTESERLVQEALTNLMKNRTSIVIAHRLSTIVHADEIVVLANGRIVEKGTHKELLALNGEYKKFYEMQRF